MARLIAYIEQLMEDGRDAGKSLMKRKKEQDQERILAEHLDEIKRGDFSYKRVCQKAKTESNKLSKERG